MNTIIAFPLKPCSICKEQKPLTEYHNPRGIIACYCKSCMISLPSTQQKYAIEGRKLCTKCAEAKPFNEFLKRTASIDGYDIECKICKRKRDIEKHEQLLTQPPIQVAEKKCRKCKQVKPSSEFYEDTSLKCSKDMLTSQCKDCMRKDAIVRASQHTYEHRRSVFIRCMYGITRKEYYRLLEEQSNVCAICKQSETKVQYSKIMELAIDHDHDNNQVRGLLCAECNQAIGFLKDDINRIASLLHYLASPPLEQALNAWHTQQRSCKVTKQKSATARRYKVSKETYDALFEFQQGVCAVCKLPETRTIKGKVKSLAIDHHHESGIVRGLLCERCNHALGNLKDSPIIIEGAMKYLQKHAR